MRDSWERRIDRASELAARDESARPLLESYRRLLVLQRDCSQTLEANGARLSGSLERDLDIVAACVPPILAHVASSGPSLLAEEARRLIDGGDGAVRPMLLTGWRQPSDELFFARIVLQPYARLLAALGRPPLDRDLRGAGGACPFCGGAPQVSILEHAADQDSGGRSLQCGTCFTTRAFRRILCPHCGEDDERKLGYFQSPSYAHVRVDACETCRRYLKSVDLTRLGLAVPIVDEVASAPLDLWAHERGYEKIELNLVGL